MTLRIAPLALLLASLAIPAAAQDSSPAFNAFAVVNATGTIMRSGEKQASVTATLAGPMFVETSEGPVNAGKVSCSAQVTVDQTTAKTAGTGNCLFTASDGATAWGGWQCEGYRLVGCKGHLTLTGGSGRLEGANGDGAMIWRPTESEFVKQLDGTVLQNVSGILIWRDFKLGEKK